MLAAKCNIWRFDDRMLSYAGNRVLNGLEVDGDGMPVAVHLCRSPDGRTFICERFALVESESLEKHRKA